MEGENLSVLDLTASSSQNSLTGDLTASSSQNSLTGGVVAGSSQNPMPGGGSCGDSELGGSSGDSEPDCGARPAVVVVPGSDLDGGSNEVAGFSGNCSQVSKSLQLHKLSEKDVPGAALNGREPSQLHVVELKRWLKCRGATTSGRKEELVKRFDISCVYLAYLVFLFLFFHVCNDRVFY